VNVIITSLGQHLDFESKVVINVLTMRLPNGDEAQLPISDEIAAQFVTAFTGNPPAPAPPTPRQPQTAHEVFGTEETEEGAAFVMNPEEEVHVAPPPPRKTPVRKSRLVGKDNAGNPIVEFVGKDVGDISDALGTIGDKDEDGVSQL